MRLFFRRFLDSTVCSSCPGSTRRPFQHPIFFALNVSQQRKADTDAKSPRLLPQWNRQTRVSA